MPPRSELKIYALHCAVPMVGFGFMDNLVMIQAGDLIDTTIGVRFGLTTLTAAAFGQIFSDVSGVCFGGTVEALALKCGIPRFKMTAEQLALRPVKLISTASAAVGVVIGCLLGMTCLFFMDLDKAERLKRQAELATLFNTIIEEGHVLLGAERCTLWLMDEDGKHCWSKVKAGEPPTRDRLKAVFSTYDTGNDGYISRKEMSAALSNLRWNITNVMLDDIMQKFGHKEKGADGFILRFDDFVEFVHTVLCQEESFIPIRAGGFKEQVIKHGKPLNIPDVSMDDRFSKVYDTYTGVFTHSLLLCPVFEADDDGGGDGGAEEKKTSVNPRQPPQGKPLEIAPLQGQGASAPASGGTHRRVIGIVEMVNKESPYGGWQAFTKEDEKLVKMLCSHASIFIKSVG